VVVIHLLKVLKNIKTNAFADPAIMTSLLLSMTTAWTIRDITRSLLVENSLERLMKRRSVASALSGEVTATISAVRGEGRSVGTDRADP
jgi:hypothetical protein